VGYLGYSAAPPTDPAIFIKNIGYSFLNDPNFTTKTIKYNSLN